MRKLVAIAGVLTLIVSFQNCAPQNSALNQTSGEAPTTYEKYSALPADKVTFWDYEKNRYIDVDLSTGYMSVFEELGGSRGEVYCMKQQELLQLESILDLAEVCEPMVDQIPEGRMCTMMYTFPYASLKVGGNEVRLGERTSGCDAPVDLCGEKSSLFKNFVIYMLENLESHKCE